MMRSTPPPGEGTVEHQSQIDTVLWALRYTKPGTRSEQKAILFNFNYNPSYSSSAISDALAIYQKDCGA